MSRFHQVSAYMIVTYGRILRELGTECPSTLVLLVTGTTAVVGFAQIRCLSLRSDHIYSVHTLESQLN